MNITTSEVASASINRPVTSAMLAFVTSAALLPGSLLPVIVTVGRHGLGFTTSQAAMLGSADMYSVAAGTLLIAIVGPPPRFAWSMRALLAAILLLDLASMSQTMVVTLVGLRAARGLVAGMMVGIGYAAIARTRSPERTFGLLLVVQFVAGGAGVALLPAWVLAHGAWLLFAVLAATSATALLLSLVVSVTSVPPRAQRLRASWKLPGPRLRIGLLALFLAEAGHTAGSVFVLEMGRMAGQNTEVTQAIAGIAALTGVLGALGAVAAGTRPGRWRPILFATVAAVLSCGLILTGSTVLFAAGLTIGAVAWAGSIPYMLGWCAALDEDGRGNGASWAGFFAKAGLASGPLMGATVAGPEIFTRAVLFAGVLSVLAGGLFWWLRDGAAGDASD